MHAWHRTTERQITALHGVGVFGVGRNQGLLGGIQFGHGQVFELGRPQSVRSWAVIRSVARLTHPSPVPPRGRLIVIEGADGAGKSTLQNGLARRLDARGIKVVQSREPTHGPHGTALREAAKIQRLAPELELDLLLKDRRAHVEGLIAPALAGGEWVILDRYYFSTIAYQGAAGLDTERLRALNEAFAPVPDLLLILDLPLEQSLERIAARGLASDDFERPATLKRVREIFLSFANLPYARILDARLARERVLDLAWEALSDLVEH